MDQEGGVNGRWLDSLFWVTLEQAEHLQKVLLFNYLCPYLMDWMGSRLRKTAAKLSVLSYLNCFLKLLHMSYVHLVSMRLCYYTLRCGGKSSQNGDSAINNYVRFSQIYVGKRTEISYLLYVCRCFSPFSSFQSTTDFKFCLPFKKTTAVGNFVNVAQGNLGYFFLSVSL